MKGLCALLAAGLLISSVSLAQEPKAKTFTVIMDGAL